MNPVVDLEAKTVTYDSKTFVMRPLAEDAYTMLIDGVPVGRAVFSFGAANAAQEGTAVSEETLTTVAEAWFAALEG